jgi:hypothetical protein
MSGDSTHLYATLAPEGRVVRMDKRTGAGLVDVADKARSVQHHHDIVKNAEDMLQAFELPYRVVAVCGGDLGVPQAMKYDIETWMPSRGNYGETHSASRFYDYQARRLDLRYRPKDGGKPMFCHTLNNTVVASPRILLARNAYLNFAVEYAARNKSKIKSPQCAPGPEVLEELRGWLVKEKIATDKEVEEAFAQENVRKY